MKHSRIPTVILGITMIIVGLIAMLKHPTDLLPHMQVLAGMIINAIGVTACSESS